MTDLSGVHNYAYDSIYQLTQATHPNMPMEQFSYDSVGNRISAEGEEVGTPLARTYTYDWENRLTKVEYSGMLAQYKYDPFGRRIEKNVNGDITRYVYHGPNVVTEYDGSGNVKNAYIHNLAIDDPLAVEQGGNIYFYHKDGLGSVMDLTNISGSVVKSYRHKSFGEIYSETGTIDQPYTFTAREYDPESGLYYYRARYYDPKAGRFLTKDPIRFAGRDVNLYRYVANDPLNRIDPHGLLNPKGQWPLYKKEDYEQGVKELSYRIREKDPSISQERATEMANDILKEMTVPEALKVEKLLKANDIEAIEKLLKDIYDRAQQKKKACP